MSQSGVHRHRSSTNRASSKTPTLKPLPRDKPLTLSQADQELLKRLLITLSKGERSIERQRQVLATLARFEPHAAFQRIDRDQDGRITSLEILRFLRDNNVEEATEADTYYMIKYFDSDGDNKLNYEDLLQMVMPCDDQYLRAAIAQRDIYEVSKHDYLESEIESELTRLFEKEIALNRVCEELKQEMDASKSFCIEKAFDVIDDWKYGFIDRKNLKSFLRKHNYVASTSECMAIIRRLDLDADARISRQEFEEGVRPGEPYSKTMKRTQIKRGQSSKNYHREGRRKVGLSVKNGQLLEHKDSERSVIKTLAIDRQHQSMSRRGLTRGTTPLKARQVNAADLSMFSCSQLSRHSRRSKKHRQPKQENQQITEASVMQQYPTSTAEPRSSRSHKSVRSARSSRHRHNSTKMRDNESMMAGSRRKKAPKQKKLGKGSRSRKSLKRQGSMDDMYIERLSKPVDHSKLKRRIERERKLQFERTKSQYLKRSSSRRSMRSSARKSVKDLHDDQTMVQKYKTLISKFGDTVDNQDQWRGVFDFTRVSTTQPDEAFDEMRSLQPHERKKRRKRERSSRAQHSSRKKHLLEYNLPLQRNQEQEHETVSAMIDLTNDRVQSQEKVPLNEIIDSQLSSIKKQIKAEQPRQIVLSKHRSNCVQKPEKILTRAEEAYFLRTLQEVIMLEKELEVRKIDLSLRDDFNMIDAFGILDQDGKGNINPQELHVSLRRLDVPASQEDCYLVFHRFNRDLDGLLKYSEFTNAFLPVDQHYARQLGSKRLQYCNQMSDGHTPAPFCYDTMKNYLDVWLQIIKTEQSFEEIKCRLEARPSFDIEKAFRSCDQSFTSAITANDIKNLMQEYKLCVPAEELQLLMYRLDKDKDSKVSFLEFKQGLTPQTHFIYQRNPDALNRPLTDQELAEGGQFV